MKEPREIKLPAGKLGVIFSGMPALVSKKLEHCNIDVELGEMVIEVSVPGKFELTGLEIPSQVVGKVLADYQASEERILKLWHKDGNLQPEAPAKIPQGKNVALGGSWWKRHRSINDSFHLDASGSSQSHASVYKEPGPNGRWLNKFGSQTRSGTEEYAYCIPQLAARMPCTYRVWLPSGPLGISFKGKTARVSKVPEDLPMIKVGQHIVECSVGDKVGLAGSSLSPAQVGQFLKENADREDRSIKLTWQDDPSYASPVALSPELAVPAPASVSASAEEEEKLETLADELEDTPTEETPEAAVVTTVTSDKQEAAPSTNGTAVAAAAVGVGAVAVGGVSMVAAATDDDDDESIQDESYKVALPAGKLGLGFRGTPCLINTIAEDSPISDIRAGHLVVQCWLGDELVLSGGALTSQEVGRFLTDNADSDKRMMRVTSFFPESYKVALPSGKLGLGFRGTPCLVNRIGDNSPVPYVEVGHTVVQCWLGDELVLSSGSLTSQEVGQFLTDNADSDQRMIALTAEKSESAPPVVIEWTPENYRVALPTGTAGLSFKGNPSKISRVADDSPLKGSSDIQIGQQVVQCLLGDKVVLSGTALTSKQVGQFLVENADNDQRAIALTKAVDKEFAAAVEKARMFSQAVPDFAEWSPPAGALPHGTWMYKEPGAEGRVLDKDGNEVRLAFSVLTEI